MLLAVSIGVLEQSLCLCLFAWPVPPFRRLLWVMLLGHFQPLVTLLSTSLPLWCDWLLCLISPHSHAPPKHFGFWPWPVVDNPSWRSRVLETQSGNLPSEEGFFMQGMPGLHTSWAGSGAREERKILGKRAGLIVPS